MPPQRPEAHPQDRIVCRSRPPAPRPCVIFPDLRAKRNHPNRRIPPMDLREPRLYLRTGWETESMSENAAPEPIGAGRRNVIEATGIGMVYESFTALDNVSFTIAEGEFVA